MNDKLSGASNQQAPTALNRGNRALREGNYEDAISLYEKAQAEVPGLHKLISSNIELAKKSLLKGGGRSASTDTYMYLIGESIDASIHKNTKKIAVIVHYFYEELWDSLKDRLQDLPPIFDLFVTVTSEKAKSATEHVLTSFPTARIHVAPNLGMDIVPFLSLIPVLANEGYYAVCKLQTKKGDGPLGAVWREIMLDGLIGCPQNFIQSVEAFSTYDDLCLIGPATVYQSAQKLMYENHNNVRTVLQNAFNVDIPKYDWGFFAGSMFWSRVDILLRLSEVANFGCRLFGGSYKKDGKIEHALERVFGALPVLNSGRIGLLQKSNRKNKEYELIISTPDVGIGHGHIGDIMRQIERIEADSALIINSGFFDCDYYVSQNPELANSSVDLVYHYLVQGCFRGKLPFRGCPDSYMASPGSKGSMVSNVLLNIISRCRRRAKVFDKELVEKTGLFDIQNYIRQCGEKLNTDSDPLEHYLLSGTYNELMPNKYFVPREYRDLHPDVVTEGVEPFYHYISKGALEGRRYRSSQWREEQESPFFRYVVLNSVLIDWAAMISRPVLRGFVSIVVPIYNQLELTKACLSSVIKSTKNINYEIICVDNGSTTEVGCYLSEFSKRNSNVRYINNKENYNFSLGCNIGYSISRGEYVVFLNNDTTVTDGWLESLIAPFEMEDVVAIQPKLLFPDGTIQNSGIVFAPKQDFGYPIYVDFPADSTCVNVPRRYQAVTAACMAIRSRVFAEAKGFDPLFINGQEDVDLCLRLTNGTGRSCYYQPESVVVHHESKTPGRGKYIKLNRRNFIQRWSNKINPDDYKYYSDDGFRIINWKDDSDELTKLGIGIKRPRLEMVSSKVNRLRYFWDDRLENELVDHVNDLYERTEAQYKERLVSVIMPTFNRASVISKAIESVLRQSHTRFELLVCDDGSSDNTECEVGRYLQDERVRYRKLPRMGVSGARNHGLDLARGDVVAYLDSDNAWNGDFLKVMLVLMESFGWQAAYCGVEAKDDNGKTLFFRGDRFYWEECLKENYIDINAFVHTRKLAEDFRFDESLKRLVDWDFILRLTRICGACYIPFIGVNYYEGKKLDRITNSEYVGDRLFQVMDYIREKCTGFYPIAKVSTSGSKLVPSDLSVGVHERADAGQGKCLSFRIKISCPSLIVSHEWGDYHFALAMKRSFQKLGHQCEIDCMDHWYGSEVSGADVVIVLRGLSRYKPDPTHVNLMWNISHPDKVSMDEYEEYDHIFVASEPYAAVLAQTLRIPVDTLLQCTDPTLFNPWVQNRVRHQLLFVGNSRNVYRPIVRDCINAALPVSVYGTRWQQFIPNEYIAGEHVENEKLPGYYAGAKIVLNDHWDSMRRFGFVSNRLFDAVACGAVVVSDDVPGISEIFKESVVTYRSEGDLQRICKLVKLGQDRTAQLEMAARIARWHSFDVRVSKLMEVSEHLTSGKVRVREEGAISKSIRSVHA